MGKLLVVKGKAGKFGSRGGGWPPGPPRAPGVNAWAPNWVPNNLDNVSPASAIFEELFVSFTDLGGVVGTIGLAFLGSDFSADPSLLSLLTLMSMPAVAAASFFAVSCLMCLLQSVKDSYKLDSSHIVTNHCSIQSL